MASLGWRTRMPLPAPITHTAILPAVVALLMHHRKVFPPGHRARRMRAHRTMSGMTAWFASWPLLLLCFLAGTRLRLKMFAKGTRRLFHRRSLSPRSPAPLNRARRRFSLRSSAKPLKTVPTLGLRARDASLNNDRIAPAPRRISWLGGLQQSSAFDFFVNPLCTVSPCAIGGHARMATVLKFQSSTPRRRKQCLALVPVLRSSNFWL